MRPRPPDDQKAATRMRAVHDWLESIDLVMLRTPVLSRASERRCHSGHSTRSTLATALIWRDRMGPLATIATHDTPLGLAAQSFGFDVRGM